MLSPILNIGIIVSGMKFSCPNEIPFFLSRGVNLNNHDISTRGAYRSVSLQALLAEFCTLCCFPTDLREIHWRAAPCDVLWTEFLCESPPREMRLFVTGGLAPEASQINFQLPIVFLHLDWWSVTHKWSMAQTPF